MDYDLSCHEVMQEVSLTAGGKWDKKIIFVTSGYPKPYPALEKSIIDSLRTAVKEVIVAHSKQNVDHLVQKHNPDLVLVFAGINFHLSQLRKIKSKHGNKGCKTAVWFTDDPYWTDVTMKIAPFYDFIFTQDLSCVSFYQSLGCSQVYYMPFAADPEIFRPKQVDLSYQTDILFVGNAFANRISFFDRIAEYLSQKNSLIIGYWWEKLRNYKMLRDKIRLNQWMTADETAIYYRGAKIVINIHRSHDEPIYNKNSRNIPALSVNPRTFEISACGTLQLTDIRQNLQQFYSPGIDIETYRSPNEFIQKVEYYLQHEKERNEMAMRGLRRTMAEHTYRNRMDHLLTIIYGDPGRRADE